MLNPRQHGEYFENLAKEYLLAQGLQLVCQNWQYKKMGELDLVMIDTQKQYAKQPDCLVIVEVRKRKMADFGTALDSIDIRKQRKIIKTTQAFLQHFPQFDNHDIRFDVVAFEICSENPPIITWLKSAFLVES